jgi:hypothetical protein
MRNAKLALGSMGLLVAGWASPEPACSRVSVRIPAASQIAVMAAASSPGPVQVPTAGSTRARRSGDPRAASPLTIDGRLGSDDTIALSSPMAFQVAVKATCPNRAGGCGGAVLSMTETRMATFGQGMPRGLDAMARTGAVGVVKVADITTRPLTLGFGLSACSITVSGPQVGASEPIEIQVTTSPVL